MWHSGKSAFQQADIQRLSLSLSASCQTEVVFRMQSSTFSQSYFRSICVCVHNKQKYDELSVPNYHIHISAGSWSLGTMYFYWAVSYDVIKTCVEDSLTQSPLSWGQAVRCYLLNHDDYFCCVFIFRQRSHLCWWHSPWKNNELLVLRPLLLLYLCVYFSL